MHRIVILLSAVALLCAEAGPGSVPGQGAGPASGAASGGGPLGGMFLPLVLGMFVLMFWLMVIRPQKKEEKRRKELIDAIKRGDEVVSIGGVHGTVEAVGEGTIDVRVGKGSETIVVTFNKGAVSTNLTAERAAAPAK